MPLSSWAAQLNFEQVTFAAVRAAHACGGSVRQPTPQGRKQGVGWRMQG